MPFIFNVIVAVLRFKPATCFLFSLFKIFSFFIHLLLLIRKASRLNFHFRKNFPGFFFFFDTLCFRERNCEDQLERYTVLVRKGVDDSNAHGEKCVKSR
jgi:hypothetical protein